VSLCKGAGDVITIVGDLTIESDVVRIIEKTIEHYWCSVKYASKKLWDFKKFDATIVFWYYCKFFLDLTSFAMRGNNKLSNFLAVMTCKQVFVILVKTKE